MTIHTHTDSAPCPPDAAVRTLAAFDEKAEHTLASLAKALGHPARVRILKMLVADDTCIAGELADELPLAASTVSQHLKILKEVARRCYCVDRSVLAHLKVLVEALCPMLRSLRVYADLRFSIAT